MSDFIAVFPPFIDATNYRERHLEVPVKLFKIFA